MGAPGTGKTLFAQQLALHNAGSDRPILYLTTLSEPLAKVVTYLQQTAFYDESKVGSSVLYEDLGSALVEQGIGALVSRVREAIRRSSPKIIIIDSFKAVHDLSTSTAEMRRVVSDLAGLLTAYETTTFLVGEYSEEEVARYPEFAVADAIVEFARRKRNSSDERYVRVSKLRGASYREGTHGFRITAAGLEFYPRLVSPDFPPDYNQTARARIHWDRGAGPACSEVASGAAIALWWPGPPDRERLPAPSSSASRASGRGSPSCTSTSRKTRLSWGSSFESLGGGLPERSGPLWNTTTPLRSSSRSTASSGRRSPGSARTAFSRVALDGIGDLLTASGDPQRVHDYLYALSQHLAQKRVSSLLTFETRIGPPGARRPADRRAPIQRAHRLHHPVRYRAGGVHPPYRLRAEGPQQRPRTCPPRDGDHRDGNPDRLEWRQ